MTWEMQVKELKHEGREEGRKEGRREGRQEGRREGRQEGRQEGLTAGRNEARSVFKLFYTGSNPSEIAATLGMKENVVREILG